MPAYSRMWLARLRELCTLCGILTEGLCKPELIVADDDLYLEDEDGDAGGDTGSERADDRGRMKRMIRMGISYPMILTTRRLDLGQLGSIPIIRSAQAKTDRIANRANATRAINMAARQLFSTANSPEYGKTAGGKASYDGR